MRSSWASKEDLGGGGGENEISGITRSVDQIPLDRIRVKMEVEVGLSHRFSFRQDFIKVL